MSSSPALCRLVASLRVRHGPLVGVQMSVWLGSLAVALACTAPTARPLAHTGWTIQSAETITSVSLERRCFGCEDTFKVTVNRDGTATRTIFGYERFGTDDRHATAEVSHKAFEALAQTVVSAGFFGLDDEYRDPQITDGAFLITTVTTATGSKVVVNSNRAGPDELQRLQAAIRALADTLPWKERAF